MSSLPRFAAGVVLSLTLAGCANADLGPKQTVGTLLGAGTGALLGAQFGHGTGQLVATSVGTLLGAYLGNEAGKSLDRADALYASRAEYQALEYTPSGNSTPWRNPGFRPLRQHHPDRDLREHGRRLLPRVPASGADRRPQPRRLRHRVSHPGRPMAGGALSERRPRESARTTRSVEIDRPGGANDRAVRSRADLASARTMKRRSEFEGGGDRHADHLRCLAGTESRSTSLAMRT